MANYTNNYNLILPDQSENYNVDVANTNNRTIDAQLGNKVDKIPGKSLSTNDFTNGYKKKVDTLQSLYRFKGNVNTLQEINNKTNQNIGDVWKCLGDNKNYCWNEEEWVDIGNDIDLSAYALEENVEEEFENIRDEMQEINERNSYSTEEVVIGTWINGKPLYRKVFDAGNLPDTTTKTITTGFSNIKCTKLYGIMYAFGMAAKPLPFEGLSDYDVRISMTQSGDIDITADYNASTDTGYVIVEYTKTTD